MQFQVHHTCPQILLGFISMVAVAEEESSLNGATESPRQLSKLNARINMSLLPKLVDNTGCMCSCALVFPALLLAVLHFCASILHGNPRAGPSAEVKERPKCVPANWLPPILLSLLYMSPLRRALQLGWDVAQLQNVKQQCCLLADCALCVTCLQGGIA